MNKPRHTSNVPINGKAVPWSGEYPLKRSEEKLYEYACHEGNYGIRHILSAQRAEEARATSR